MTDWFFTLAILCMALSLVGLVVFSDWERNKKFLAYLLIALFAQTGFAYAVKVGWRTCPTSVAELLYFGSLILMGFAGLSNKEAIPDIGMKWPIRIYLICSLIGVFTAIRFSVQPINIFIEVKAYVGYIFYLYLIPYLMNDEEDIKKCLWAFVIFSLIPIAYAIPNLKALSQIEGVEREDLVSGWGTSNVFIGFIVPVIFIAFSLIGTTSGRPRKGFLLFFTGICLFLLLYSRTRTGWITFSLSLILFAFLIQKKAALVLASIVLIILLSFTGKFETIQSIVQDRIIEQTIDEPDSSLEIRYARWRVAWATFKAHPLFGSGWGGYLLPLEHGGVRDTSLSILPRWHNSFFEILSQLGIFGVFCFYWIWVRIFKFSFQAWRKVKDSQEKFILSGLISAVTSVLIYSLGEQQFYKIETASVSWFITGLLIAYIRLLDPTILNPLRSQTH